VDDQASFAARIRERFPEGLTGIFAFGGTRTTYILARNRTEPDPGKIADFDAYGDFVLERTRAFIQMFFELGGQNMIIPELSYQSFYERGPEYTATVIALSMRLIDDEHQAFYRDHGIDPYFVGIDTLLHLPSDQPEHQLGAAFARFQAAWPYQDGWRKLIWEVAPIPLYTFLHAKDVMGEAAHAALEADLAAATDMETMHRLLYKYYARAAYGTDLPNPHFYLGANRNGDLKLRAMVPIALTCGSPMRLYYTPYPSFFMTKDAFRHVLEDVAFGRPMRSKRLDYAGRLTGELVEAEYQRVAALGADPASTLGLSRTVGDGSL
jgi:hypothetical protein